MAGSCQRWTVGNYVLKGLGGDLAALITLQVLILVRQIFLGFQIALVCSHLVYSPCLELRECHEVPASVVQVRYGYYIIQFLKVSHSFDLYMVLYILVHPSLTIPPKLNTNRLVAIG